MERLLRNWDGAIRLPQSCLVSVWQSSRLTAISRAHSIRSLPNAFCRLVACARHDAWPPLAAAEAQHLDRHACVFEDFIFFFPVTCFWFTSLSNWILLRIQRKVFLISYDLPQTPQVGSTADRSDPLTMSSSSDWSSNKWLTEGSSTHFPVVSFFFRDGLVC